MRHRFFAILAGLLLLTLASGRVQAETSPAAAYAFDLLARVAQWQSAGPLDFLPSAAKDQPVPAAAQARIQAGYGRLPMHFEPNAGRLPTWSNSWRDYNLEGLQKQPGINNYFLSALPGDNYHSRGMWK